MQKLQEAIKNGHTFVFDYIQNNTLTTSDISLLNKYQKTINDFSLAQAILNNKNNQINDFYQNQNDLKNTESFVLIESIKHNNNVNHKEILTELINRINKKEIKYTRLIPLLAKIDDLSVLKNLNKESISYLKLTLQDKLSKANLTLSKNFDFCYKLQTSTLFNQSLISLSDFKQTLTHWNKKEEQIKKLFYFFDVQIVDIAPTFLKNNYIVSDLVEFYIKEHIKNNDYYLDNKNQVSELKKNEFKVKMLKIANFYQLHETISLLNSITIDNSLINCQSSKVHKKIKL